MKSRNLLLEGRIALVTGASRSIGAATATLLASQGAAVAVNYLHSRKRALELVDSIESADGRAIAVRADVRERDQVDAMVKEVNRHLGAIDTLVLNASIGFPTVPILDFSWEAFEAKLTGELKAAFFSCQAVAPSMVESGGGCIVVVSSGLSRFSAPRMSAHSTAKAGLDSFARSLAIELAHHSIRVNTVGPGLTITDATAGLPQDQKDAIAQGTPLGRNAEPEDVAGVILTLASDYSGFVTGSYVPVSGGRQML